MKYFQLTIPSSGILQLTDPSPSNNNTYFQQITIQNNNATGNMRVGDSTVSATVGIVLYPGGGSFAASAQLALVRMADFWVYGTSGALVDVLVVQ